MTEEQEEIVRIPEPIEYPVTEEAEPEPVLEEAPQEEENAVEDLADIARVTKEDIMGKKDGNSEPDDMSDLVGLDEEDIGDVLEVSESDIMGDEELIPGTPPSPEPELPRRQVRPMQRFRRTSRRYLPPPSPSIGGIRE